MLEEGLLGGHRLLEAGEVVVGADAAAGHGARDGVVLEVGLPVEIVGVGLVRLDLWTGRLARRRLGARVALELDAVLHLDRGDGLLVGRAHLARLLEQGVLEQFVANEVLEFDAGELKELDGLLQLWGHHELLGHPQLLAHMQDHEV